MGGERVPTVIFNARCDDPSRSANSTIPSPARRRVREGSGDQRHGKRATRRVDRARKTKKGDPKAAPLSPIPEAAAP
jgi:hypothetical protein